MTWVLVVITVLATGFGEIAMTKAMKETGEIDDFRPHAWLRSLFRALKNGWLVFSVACMALAFFSFMTLLSTADLSFAVPATAASYVVQTVGARYFLNEKVSPTRWAGTVLVMAGVALISLR
jgi:drug/metabolite transporter (DMT)-like permease